MYPATSSTATGRDIFKMNAHLRSPPFKAWFKARLERARKRAVLWAVHQPRGVHGLEELQIALPPGGSQWKAIKDGHFFDPGLLSPFFGHTLSHTGIEWFREKNDLFFSNYYLRGEGQLIKNSQIPAGS